MRIDLTTPISDQLVLLRLQHGRFYRLLSVQDAADMDALWCLHRDVTLGVNLDRSNLSPGDRTVQDEGLASVKQIYFKLRGELLQRGTIRQGLATMSGEEMDKLDADFFGVSFVMEGRGPVINPPSDMHILVNPQHDLDESAAPSRPIMVYLDGGPWSGRHHPMDIGLHDGDRISQMMLEDGTLREDGCRVTHIYAPTNPQEFQEGLWVFRYQGKGIVTEPRPGSVPDVQ